LSAYCLRSRHAVVLALLVMAIPPLSRAAQPPDAGTILREQPKPPVVPAPALKPPAVEAPVAKPGEDGPLVLVKAIRIEGATLISERELVAQMTELVGREVSLGQLQAAALVLIGYYAQKGYLARVFLPPQEIADGIVRYRVVEGVRGGLNIREEGPRLDAARVRRFVEARLPAGAPMDMAALGEALNILNEQPGVSATSSLAPGQDERAIDVTVSAKATPLTSFRLGGNNEGSRGTGIWQATGGLTLNNPTGRFDALSLLLNAAEGSTFGRVDYGIAVGERGLRLGVNASALDYKIVQQSFSALGSEGTAETYGLTASYPLARRTDFSLSLIASLDHKRLVDHTVAGETGKRIVEVANVGLAGYTLSTREIISGVWTFGANLAVGDTDQRNALALAADQLGRQVQGGFTKLAWNAGWLRPLDADWTLSSALRGQLASKNLDSSERFSLGGPSGVRAYPVSEGTGDAGWLLNVELTRRLGQFNVGGFVDVGGVTLNRILPPGGTAVPNNYTLAGAGLSLTWLVRTNTSLRATLAAPIGDNPGKDVNSRNADARPNRPRAWVGFNSFF